MHDPEFEKKVQQKMEELAFSPSEEVWTNLERQINKKKKRRLPLFWLFFLSGLMLAGASGAYFILHPRTGSPVTRTSSSSLPSAPSSVPPPVAGSPNAVASVPSAINPASASVPGASGSASFPAASSSVSVPAAANTTSVPVHGKSPVPYTTIPGSVPGTSNLFSPPRSLTRQHKAPGSSPFQSPGSAGLTDPSRELTSAVTPGSSEPQSSSPALQVPELQLPELQPSPTGSIVPPGPGAAGDPASIPFTIGSPYTKLTARPLPGIAGSAAAKKPAPVRPSPWIAGFAGGAGLSSVSEQRTRQLASASAYAPGVNLTSGVQPASARDTTTPRSRQDVSVWAGIFAQRPILKKLSLSIGLNVHYYSTLVETGKQVSAPLTLSGPTVTSSLFYSTAVVLDARSYPYYPPGQGNTFTNKYYFLEVPVSLQWQLDRNNKIPVIWEAGLSLARLMSENALYYNTSSGSYYKDGSGVANLVQLSLSTSFMVGLTRGSSRFQLGPQIQYGLTSLVNASAGGAQHLFYGGLKFTFVPGRK